MMKKGLILIAVVFSLVYGNAWATDEVVIQELQTDVSVAKTKADQNAAEIQSLKGGLPAEAAARAGADQTEAAARAGADQNLQNQINSIQLTLGPQVLPLTGGILSTSQSKQCVKDGETVSCSPITTVLIAMPENNQYVYFKAYASGEPMGNYMVWKHYYDNRNEFLINVSCWDCPPDGETNGDDVYPQKPIFTGNDWEPGLPFPIKVFMVTESLVRVVLDGVDYVEQVSSKFPGTIDSAEIEFLGEKDARLKVRLGLSCTSCSEDETEQYILGCWTQSFMEALRVGPAQFVPSLSPVSLTDRYFEIHCISETGWPTSFSFTLELRSAFTGKIYDRKYFSFSGPSTN